MQEEMAVLLASWGEMEGHQITIEYSNLKQPEKPFQTIFSHVNVFIYCVKWTADYFMLLCATVVRDAAGEVGVTGGTPIP